MKDLVWRTLIHAAGCLSTFTLVICTGADWKILDAGDDICISCHRVQLRVIESCQWQQPRALHVPCRSTAYVPAMAGMQTRRCPPLTRTTRGGCPGPGAGPVPLPWGCEGHRMCGRRGGGRRGRKEQHPLFLVLSLSPSFWLQELPPYSPIQRSLWLSHPWRCFVHPGVRIQAHSEEKREHFLPISLLSVLVSR